ncbi:hypothetical protein CASFOL_002448 [Castilleja foliolosa]|uniref:Uncharacterized protein n=1 Tax=Castilleja foliolosa TaxID=1961234 RepID=A0ABD3EEM3_9LAMI
MAKSSATLIALFCFFTLSLASHAPPVNDEATTHVAVHNPNEPINSEKQFNTFVVSSTKWTKIPFREVNRHFSVRSKLPCRHHRKFRPYSKDMVIPSGENSDFEAPVVYGERVSGRWFRLHRHQNHGDDDEGQVKKTAFKRHVYNRFDKEEGLKGLKNGGFVRKFLDKYF